jgi:two-component sensor histidine kinase
VRIEKIVQDKQGHKYMATKGMGLIVWPRHSDPYFITREQGLLSDILEDVNLGDQNQVWVASIQGITQLTFDSLGHYNLKNYTTSHGLPSPDVYHSVWSNGKLFAATGQGILEIQPLPIDSTVYTPVLTSVKVNNQEIISNSPYVFNHYENNIKITFESIDFFQGRNTRFQYSINEGIPIKLQQRYIDLTNLLPGDYKIEISSVNHDNIISKPAVFHMTIKKPWYQTLVFGLILFALFLLTTFFIVRARIKFLKKKNEIANEIIQLEKAALQAQMNPHFIFNCLNSIQSFIVKNDREKAMEYLSSFAHLIRQYLNSSTLKYITLSEEINLLTNYIELEKLRFNHSFDYKIVVENSIQTSDVSIPPMLLQPFVENAIIHGMKDKKDKEGYITIHFQLEESCIYVRITDNGNGVQALDPSQNKHKSMGTNITQKRIQHILKSKNPEFNFNIESGSLGTVVHLRIPFI